MLLLIIILVAIFTGIVAVIAARDVIWDKDKKTWLKFRPIGYAFVFSAVSLVILPIFQYVYHSVIY